jgi:hypothetical protein
LTPSLAAPTIAAFPREAAVTRFDTTRWSLIVHAARSRLRRRLVDVLREEIGRTVESHEDVDDELRWILEVLARDRQSLPSR